ncbi:hypothetical protein [Corynebacterium resistens]|nr:hypothetical protein [Corynebacterium resistens]
MSQASHLGRTAVVDTYPRPWVGAMMSFFSSVVAGIHGSFEPL